MPRLFCLALLVVGAVPAGADDHFEKRVRPLLVEHCQSCHGGTTAGKTKVQGGLDLTGPAGLRAGGDSGPAVEPGRPDKSRLIEAVHYAGDLKMPPKGKLPAADIAALTEWVKAGAPWPDAAPVTAPGASASPLFTPEQKQFWAFQPVRPVTPPAVRDTAWPQSPIDQFILAKLEAANLSPAGPADRRTLIRRVTFDLTGLPPTPDEVDAFEADPSPTAFERVVDRLLASPHYGERWGRHWLDVARYADSNGMDENTGFANAWRYRDWVVRAVNADRPVDQFLTEQLAGDLLPKSADASVQLDRRTATGYLVVGPKLLAEPDKQKMLLDIADEQLDTVTRGMMGLTLACARCHDHKFDPLPTRDYYSLLAVFTGTRTMRSLATVAEAHEVRHPAADTPHEAKTRAALLEARKDVMRLERQFGTAKDAAERAAIHARAEGKRTLVRWLTRLVPTGVAVLAVEEGSDAAYGTRPRNLYVQARGNYPTPREEAPAVFPRILAGEEQAAFISTTPNPADVMKPNTTRFGQLRAGSGRLELARWLTSPTHPLTARVFVNRVWAHHFGAGIVRTVDNFGRLGERPSHPELLDYLSARFIADGWSLKQLHRTMLLTRTYQMAGGPAPLADPDNRLLSRHPRRRLEAEPIRDAMLAAAGTLDRTVGGTAFPAAAADYVHLSATDYDRPRRSLYLPVVRSRLFGFFQTFDFADPTTATGQRATTTVAPQALFMMNSPFVRAQAEALAARVHADEPADEGKRVTRLHRLAYGRPATSAEVDAALGFVAKYAAASSGRTRASWAALCQAVLAGNEFLFVD